jgi:excisionase family DNA binding protein
MRVQRSARRFKSEEHEMAATSVIPVPDKLFVGRDTAAQLLDVSTRTIDDAIRAGDLEAYRLGRRVLIRRDALIQFAERITA